jgi:hypothetical protein
MSNVTLKTGQVPETADRLLEEVKSLSDWTACEKFMPTFREETVPAKGTIYEEHDFLTTAYGYYGPDATSPAKYDLVALDSGLPSPVGAGAIFQISSEVKGCVSVADMFGALGTVEKMEAKPKRTEDSAKTARLREVRPAPELYPDLDLDRIRARAAELSTASSDSEAVSAVLGRSVQIVHQEE